VDLDRISDAVARWCTAARGLQVTRKDKDLMRDTGGTSKGRLREPEQRPPREDLKDRHRDKRLTPDEKKEVEPDDREVKKPVRRKSSTEERVMQKERIAKMANKVAQGEIDDEPLSMVDQAVDLMIASVKVIEENLPKVKADNVPQQAALDTVKELMDEAIMPYLADIAKAMQVFE